MGVDVLDYDDCVVNYEANCCRYAAQGHQVKGQSDDPHCEDRDQDGDGYDDEGDQRGAPVSKEPVHYYGGQYEPENYGVSNRADRVLEYQGLIVKRLQRHVAGYLRLHRFQFGFHLIYNGQGACGGLAVDVNESRRVTVGSYDDVLGLDALVDGGDIRDEHGDAVHTGDDDLVEIFGAERLARDEGELELMVFIDEPRGFNNVGVFDGVDNLLAADIAGSQALGIQGDVKLASLSALNRDKGDSGQPGQVRLYVIGCEVAKACRITDVGSKAVADNGEYGKGHPFDVADLGSGRQVAGELGKAALNDLQRLDHVGIPVEEQIDFGCASLGARANAGNTRNAIHSLFYRPGD